MSRWDKCNTNHHTILQEGKSWKIYAKRLLQCRWIHWMRNPWKFEMTHGRILILFRRNTLKGRAPFWKKFKFVDLVHRGGRFPYGRSGFPKSSVCDRCDGHGLSDSKEVNSVTKTFQKEIILQITNYSSPWHLHFVVFCQFLGLPTLWTRPATALWIEAKVNYMIIW